MGAVDRVVQYGQHLDVAGIGARAFASDRSGLESVSGTSTASGIAAVVVLRDQDSERLVDHHSLLQYGREPSRFDVSERDVDVAGQQQRERRSKPAAGSSHEVGSAIVAGRTHQHKGCQPVGDDIDDDRGSQTADLVEHCIVHGEQIASTLQQRDTVGCELHRRVDRSNKTTPRSSSSFLISRLIAHCAT